MKRGRYQSLTVHCPAAELIFIDVLDAMAEPTGLSRGKQILRAVVQYVVMDKDYRQRLDTLADERGVNWHLLASGASAGEPAVPTPRTPQHEAQPAAQPEQAPQDAPSQPAPEAEPTPDVKRKLSREERIRLDREQTRLDRERRKLRRIVASAGGAQAERARKRLAELDEDTASPPSP